MHRRRKPVVTFSADDPHAVYWIYDQYGRVIYIGSSHDPQKRLGVHMATSSWRREIARMEVVAWYPSQLEARSAERLAIRAEDPDHNFHHTELALIVNRTRMADRRRVNAEARAARAERIRQEIAALIRTAAPC